MPLKYEHTKQNQKYDSVYLTFLVSRYVSPKILRH